MCAMAKAVTGRPENIIPLFDFYYSIPQFSKIHYYSSKTAL